jgi:DNA-binding LacI/PurR family transcriptional regulator
MRDGQPASKPVTMDDVAARAGVSRATVSLALRGSAKISPLRTRQVIKAARELEYRPNANASQLARSGRSTVAVLLVDLHNPILADVLDAFAQDDPDSPLEMYLASGFNSAARERQAVESFLAHRVRGVVLMGSRLPDADISDLASQVPTVVVGRSIVGIDSVRVNDETGGRLAAEHLLSLGHRQLGHIDGGTGAGAQRRWRAFLEVAQAAGASTRVEPGNYSQAAGYDGAAALMAHDPRPTGIFAANDLTALGVIARAREQGLEAGRDYALCGFDDVAFAAYGYVSLTSISYSRETLGRIARELLDRRTSNPAVPPETILLEPTLVVRSSTAGAPAPGR